MATKNRQSVVRIFTGGACANPNSKSKHDQKQADSIGKLLTEIALATTPIVIGEGRRWLECRKRPGSTTPIKRTPKPKTA
jgi:hypothetical protein